jgi:signal transduction histidine kinase
MVITVFLLEGKTRFIVATMELILYLSLSFSVYYRQYLAMPHKIEWSAFIDSLIVSVVIYVIVTWHLKLYDQQKAELEAARRQADERARAKGELFAEMSHEMRTPLSVISGYAQYAAEQIQKGAPNDQILANLGIISKKAQRLAEISDNALATLMSSNETGEDATVERDEGGGTQATIHPPPAGASDAND